MYGMLALQQLFVYLTRFGYSYLVPFIVNVSGLIPVSPATRS